MKFKLLALAISLAGALMLTGQAQAELIIDDWNVTTGDSVADTTADGNRELSIRNSVGGTSLSRTFFMANLTVGDSVSTEDCALCQAGYFTNAASSEGHGYWGWNTGIFLDLTAFNSIMLDVSSNVDGLDIILSFGDGIGVIGEVWWKDLSSTTNLALEAALPSGLVGVTEIFLDVFSLGGTYTDPSPTNWLGTRDYGSPATSLDLYVDNLKLVSVPEPSIIVLMGLGLAGIGYSRCRS